MPERAIDQWLARYAVCHQNPTNKRIHWVCVPVILATILGLLRDVPFPVDPQPGGTWWASWSSVFVGFCLIFYVYLSPQLALGMLIWSACILYLLECYQQSIPIPLWQSCLTVFVIAWVGQFIGHKIEGKKPAFFDDLQFLLIGPLWLLSFLYKRLGMNY